LVTIQPNGDKVPLFMVPGVGGNVLMFAHLANYLGSDQPLYGLQSRGHDGQQTPLESIEDMARYYIEDIRKVQPRGPYFLAGACMGGVVAFEMAQRLLEIDEEIGFLALIETGSPTALSPLRKKFRSIVYPVKFLSTGVIRHALALLSRSPRQWATYLRDKGTIVKEMIHKRDIYRGDRKVFYEDLVASANYRAMAKYVPTTHSGKVNIFLARSVDTEEDPRLNWGKLAESGYSVYLVPAPDSGQLFMEPAVREFSNQLVKAMDDSSGWSAEGNPAEG
jgi:aspartate racemase